MAEAEAEAARSEEPTPLAYREAVEDMYVRPHDALGRQQPRVIGPLTYFTKIPALARAFTETWKTVPGEYWAQDSVEGVTHAIVACPCGASPKVEIGLLDSCVCGRTFWYAHDAVLVANSPRPEPPTTAAS